MAEWLKRPTHNWYCAGSNPVGCTRTGTFHKSMGTGLNGKIHLSFFFIKNFPEKKGGAEGKIKYLWRTLTLLFLFRSSQ
jgi:hypothetical protein